MAAEICLSAVASEGDEMAADICLRMSPLWRVFVPCIYRTLGGVTVRYSGLYFCACSMCDVNCSSALSVDSTEAL